MSKQWREVDQSGIRPLTLRSVRIPNGEPPVALKGQITDGVIRQWALETREAFRRRGMYLMCEGLCYLLRMYFIDESDYPRAYGRAERVIMEMGDRQ